MHIFTLIDTPDEGGIYIKQIEAIQPIEAFLIWAKTVQSDHSIPNLDEARFMEDVMFETTESAPTLIDGTSNVWCAGLTGMWVHIVKTAA